MAFLRKNLWVVICLSAGLADACPACLTSESAGSVSQRLLVTGIMGIFPIAVAVAIGFKIYEICRARQQDDERQVGR